MKSVDLKTFRKIIREGRISWRKHALKRLAERGIAQKDVLAVLLSGKRIEDYPDDEPYPSALFLEFVSSKPLHVLAAFDEINLVPYIITAYEPSLDVFEKDYMTRRTE